MNELGCHHRYYKISAISSVITVAVQEFLRIAQRDRLALDLEPLLVVQVLHARAIGPIF